MKSSHYYYCKLADALKILYEAKNVSIYTKGYENLWYARIEKFEYGLVALKAATMEFVIDSKAGKIKLKHAEARKFKNQKDRDEHCELCWQRPRRCIKEYNNLKSAITACAVLDALP